MGLLDDYLNESNTKQQSAKPVSNTGSGIVDLYLNSHDSETAAQTPDDSRPRPFTAEESAAAKARPATNPRDSQLWEGIKNTPKALWNDFLTNESEAAKEILGGGADVLSNKSASGVGRIGIGAFGILPPIAAAGSVIRNLVTKPGTELTGEPAKFKQLNIFGNPVTGQDITIAGPGERAGFVAGAGLPLGQATKVAIKNMPKNVAMRELVDKITSGGRDPQALTDTIAAMKADPRIGPADTSPAVLSMAQKLFVTEGDQAKKYLFDTSKARMAGLPEDVTKAYDAAAGTPVNVVNKLNELAAASKKAGTDIINPALAASKPVNISNTLTEIDNVLKPGVLKIGDSVPLTEVKKELENIRKSLRTSKEYDANDLHKFQSGLRRTASSLMKSGDGGEREVGRALMNVRNNLVNDIDAAGPKIKIIEDGVEKEVGQYKHGLSQFRDESNIADSFRMGYDGVLSNSKKMENMPEFTEKWFKNLSDHEKEAVKEGIRLRIKTEMGVSGNPSLAGTNLSKSDFNKQKLEMVFGKDETTKLLRDLENTRAIKNTDQKLIENSQTAMRLAGDKAVALPIKGEGGSVLNYALPIAGEYATTMMGQPGIGAALGMGALAVKKAGSEAAFAIKTKLAKERNAQLAKYALPTQGPQRDELIQQLEAIANANAAPKQSILRKMTGIVNP